MMRPMKLAGDQLMFGRGCLAFLETLPYKRAFIVTGGSSMEKSGMLARVEGHLRAAGAETRVFRGVEPDPSFGTVKKGAAEMLDFKPDLVVGLGGGSPMDAAKAMWVYYEHPQLQTLEDMLAANPFPKLRGKARLVCIPSTAGSASEVSRSVVITQAGKKYGFGNMELMPDIAICDPEVTVSMPPRVTAETGMDAMTHALEALVSNRANYVSGILARQAVRDIYHALPKAVADGTDLDAREVMLNASLIAGLAFTNVSLGIVHSMAHALGGAFHLSHGLTDAVLLPYVVDYNAAGSAEAAAIYGELARQMEVESIAAMVRELNRTVGIPATLSKVIGNETAFKTRLDALAAEALADGCTKTNPVIPDIDGFKQLLMKAYTGE